VQAHDRSLRYLVKLLLAPDAPRDPATESLTLLAIVRGPGAAVRKVERDALAKRLLTQQNAQGSFAVVDDRKSSAAIQALAAAALAAVYEQTHDLDVFAAITRARDALQTSLGDELDVATLPWLGDFEDALRLGTLVAANQPAASTQPSGPSSTAPQPLWVREGWAERLWARQIRTEPALGPTDVLGGFDLGPASRLAPMPDWRSAQVLVFLAHELKVRPPADRRRRLLTMLDAGLAARFLAQLMFDEPSAFYVRSRAEVLGGVRASLWDNRLANAFTATTLLAVVELQEALDQLNADSPLVPAGPATEPSSPSASE